MPKCNPGCSSQSLKGRCADDRLELAYPYQGLAVMLHTYVMRLTCIAISSIRERRNMQVRLVSCWLDSCGEPAICTPIQRLAC